MRDDGAILRGERGVGKNTIVKPTDLPK